MKGFDSKSISAHVENDDSLECNGLLSIKLYEQYRALYRACDNSKIMKTTRVITDTSAAEGYFRDRKNEEADKVLDSVCYRDGDRLT